MLRDKRPRFVQSCLWILVNVDADSRDGLSRVTISCQFSIFWSFKLLSSAKKLCTAAGLDDFHFEPSFQQCLQGLCPQLGKAASLQNDGEFNAAWWFGLVWGPGFYWWCLHCVSLLFPLHRYYDDNDKHYIVAASLVKEPRGPMSLASGSSKLYPRLFSTNVFLRW